MKKAKLSTIITATLTLGMQAPANAQVPTTETQLVTCNPGYTLTYSEGGQWKYCKKNADNTDPNAPATMNPTPIPPTPPTNSPTPTPTTGGTKPTTGSGIVVKPTTTTTPNPDPKPSETKRKEASIVNATRYVDNTAKSTNSFLEQICPYKNIGQTAAGPRDKPNPAREFVRNFKIDGLEAGLEGMCRIKNSHNEYVRGKTFDTWGSMAEITARNLVGLTEMDPKKADGYIKEMWQSAQNGAVDIMETIGKYGNAYLSTALQNPYKYEPGLSVKTRNGRSVDPMVHGMVNAEGKLDTNPLDEAIWDPKINTAIFKGREAIEGLGAIFANQEGSTQSMEASARRMQNTIETAYSILGGPGNMGAIQTRIEASKTATSLREQMIAQTQAITDGTRAMVEQNISILGQLSDNARLSAATNHLLAMQATQMYKDRMEEVNAQIDQVLKESEQEALQYQQASQEAQRMLFIYDDVSSGSGMTRFSFSQAFGLPDQFEQAEPGATGDPNKALEEASAL